MCSPPPLCILCWSVTRPRISKMPNFCLIYSRQCISCYPEKRICCMSSGWPRRRWRRPWRGSGISWSKTRSPPTSGGGRSPSKSASWSAIYRRKILRKYIFLYKEQFLFYFLCRIWFWLHLVELGLETLEERRKKTRSSTSLQNTQWQGQIKARDLVWASRREPGQAHALYSRPSQHSRKKEQIGSKKKLICTTSCKRLEWTKPRGEN